MSEQSATKRIMYWQEKLLPVLIGVPIILAMIFIYSSSVHVEEFYDSLNDTQEDQFIGKVIPSPMDSLVRGNMDYVKWVTLVHMEDQILNRRYKQAGFLLMSRVLTKYLGFFTGMILAIVGAIFIVAKLSESRSVIGGAMSEQFKFNVASSSPGILFGCLGTALMLTAIVIHPNVDLKEQPMYLNAFNIEAIKDAVKQKKIQLGDLDSADRNDQAKKK